MGLRPLAAWTEHVFVGAGDGPCAILMVGARPENEELRYPVVGCRTEAQRGRGHETSSGREAYAPFSKSKEGRYTEGSLPNL